VVVEVGLLAPSWSYFRPSVGERLLLCGSAVLMGAVDAPSGARSVCRKRL